MTAPFIYDAPWGKYVIRSDERAEKLTREAFRKAKEAGELRVLPAWECWDCGEDTREDYYRVHDHLWSSLDIPEIVMLHRVCLEKRLGRKLTRADFTDSYCNEEIKVQYE